MNDARSSLCVLVAALLLVQLLSKVNVSFLSSVSLAAVGFLLEERSRSIRFISSQSPLANGFVPRAVLHLPLLPPPIHCAQCHHFFSSLLFRSTLCYLSPNVSLSSHMCHNDPSTLHPCPLSCLIPIRSSKLHRCPIFMESICFNLCSQRFSPPFSRSYRCVAQASDLLMSHFDFVFLEPTRIFAFIARCILFLFSFFGAVGCLIIAHLDHPLSNTYSILELLCTCVCTLQCSCSGWRVV